MRLHRAELRDFRNIASAHLSFSTQFLALVGPNGQGKTNALEGLYFLFGLRPLRLVARRALIREGAESAHLEASITRRSTGLRHDLAIDLAPRSRVLQRDQKKQTTRSYVGTGVAISFTPDDLSLGKGSPERRRRFLDRALLNLYPAYLDRALRYQRALKDRNRLLTEGAPNDVLDAYDEVLSALGASVSCARARFIDEIRPRIEEHFRRIAHPAPELRIAYAPALRESLDPESESATRGAYRELLESRRRLDRKRGKTTVGPHLDDLALSLDGQPVRERASQGQFRAIALSLKLAELSHLAQVWGEPPLLLLDDMSSELDRTRSRQLFDTVTHLDGQVVLTSTDTPSELRKTLDLGEDLTVVRVESGDLRTDDSP